MIKDYENWKVFESFGEGEETFEDKLDMYGQMKNLHIVGFKDEWGDLDDAKGELVYKASLVVSKSGIDEITFMLQSVKLNLDIVKYTGEHDEDGTEEEIVLTMENEMIPLDNVSYEIRQIPYHLRSLEIDLSDVDDLKNPEDLKKTQYEFIIGSDE